MKVGIPISKIRIKINGVKINMHINMIIQRTIREATFISASTEYW